MSVWDGKERFFSLEVWIIQEFFLPGPYYFLADDSVENSWLWFLFLNCRCYWSNFLEAFHDCQLIGSNCLVTSWMKILVWVRPIFVWWLCISAAFFLLDQCPGRGPWPLQRGKIHFFHEFSLKEAIHSFISSWFIHSSIHSFIAS